jgi:hypothetical protein
MGFLNADAPVLYFAGLDAIQLALCYSCEFSPNLPSPRALIFEQGKSKSAKEVLKRIDYGGSFTLLISVSLMHCPIMSFSTMCRLVRSSCS